MLLPFPAMLRLCAVFCLALLLAPPTFAQDGADLDVEIARDLADREALLKTDDLIRERIRNIVIELEGYDGVTYLVRSGIVTLKGEVIDAAALARLEQLVTSIDGVLAVQNEVAESTDLAKRLNPAVARIANRLRQAVAFLPLVAVAVAAACAVIFLGLVIARLRQPWDRMAPNAFIADIYRQILRLVFTVGGIVIALDILNATALLGTILGAAGIIGLAIGFAVKDTVENFIASIMLSVRQPFQPNDAVEIDGDQGKVIRLTSRATILLSFDGNHIRIPNATVFKSRIVNFSRNAERRFLFQMAVEADCDLADVRRIMERTVTDLPFTLEQPGTAVWIGDITDAGVVFNVTGWVDQRETSLLRARGEALRLVKAAIEAAGYSIPDTTYRIRLDGTAPALSDSPAPIDRPELSHPAPPPEAPVGTDVKDDEALEDMIAQERNDTTNPDLLRHNAPTE